MKTFKVITKLFALLFATTMLSQGSWSAEFRPGISFPTKTINGSDLTTGFGFDMKISYFIMPHLSAYAGWGWNQFDVKETNLNDPKIDVEETGYILGVELKLPLDNSSISYFINTGTVYNHIKMENNTNSTVIDTDHGFGWQIGGGMAYEFIENWSLRPEVRYRFLTRNIIIENILTDISLNYIGFGIGISTKF